MPRRLHVPGSLLAAWVVVLPMVATAQTPVALEAVPADHWQITAATPTSRVNRLQALSPDGQWLAGPSGGRDFCVWAAATLESTCVTVAPPSSSAVLPNVPSYAWAPDSSAVAFPSSDPALSDSDLLVFEVATGRVTNLTDDGYDQRVDVFRVASGIIKRTDSYGIPLDDTPVWSPDSQQIAFSRLVLHPEGVWESLMQIDRSGGDPVEIDTLGSIWPVEVRTPMAWLPDDTLLYTQIAIGALDDPRGGLWRAIPMGGTASATGQARQLLPAGPDALIPNPILHDMDSHPGLVSLLSYGTFLSSSDVPVGAGFGILNLVNSSLTPLPEVQIDGRAARPASPAVFSPDGTMALLVYATDEATHLVLIDLATGAHQVLEHAELGAPRWVVSEWATNDTVLVAGSEYLTLIQLEPAPGATPVA
jgi:hypothetical protein